MRNIILIGAVLLVLIAGTIFTIATNKTPAKISFADKKIMIAYYSHSGNTKSLAKMIQSQTGGDMFEIQPKTAYPNDYTALTELAKNEQQSGKFPELADNGNTGSYEVIFVGTPVWWGTMSNPVKTFLTVNNFDGKTVIPFCTHGGGGASATFSDIQKFLPNSKVSEGFSAQSNSAKLTEVKAWLEKIPGKSDK